MKRKTLSTAVVLAGTLWSATASAVGPGDTGTLSFILENDLFYDVDQHYTNGVGFIWIPGSDVSTPGWAASLVRAIPWFPQDGRLRHGYAFGQSMFTPSDIKIANPPLTERPYAGWLYGTFGVATEVDERLDLLALTVGMVGPAAMAEQSQKVVHEAIGSPEPQGWDTQLHNELGVVVQYQRSWRGALKYDLTPLALDVTPSVGGAVGNVFTYASAGVMLRLGQRLPHDYGPPQIQPGLLGSGGFAPVGAFGWYLFGGVAGRAVARNIFLDGNTFGDSRSVRRDPFIGDLQWGVVLEWPKVRLSYTHILRSREYESQTAGDEFGAISLSVKF